MLLRAFLLGANWLAVIAWAAGRGVLAGMDDVAGVLDLIARSTRWLEERGIGNARREAEWIFCAALGCDRMGLYLRHEMPLASAELAQAREMLRRRGRREPLAYVLGTQPFCGLELTVGPGVLVPRPETEELVERVLAVARPRASGRLLDVGTGSGAIALACAAALGSDWRVEASDISEAALTLASDNAARLGLSVGFHRGHLAVDLDGGWDLVVANLPYIGEDERGDCDPELLHEPPRALFAGPDGLALLRELIADAPRLLAPDGEMWLEHGWRQGPALRALAAQTGLRVDILVDAAGQERMARVRR